jgi:2-polyprenyl-6-hydroxyphenyl methylase/3-demethylubiquinone-9 3-methyltransferase
MNISNPPKHSDQAAPNPSRSTIDDAEIEKFEKMAEDWWNPDGPFKPLHALNPLRIQFIRDQLIQHFQRGDPLKPTPLRGLTILDIGCGGGLLCEPMTRLGAMVTGVDAADRNIDIARTHAQRMELSIDYRCAAAEDLAAEGLAFDVVLNMEVVEHVAEVDLFLNAAARLVRPGGLMIVATLNRTAKSYALAIVGAEYIMRWLPVGTHDWLKFVRPSELARSLRTANMKIETLTGLTYNPLKETWSLNERDLDVNYIATAIRTNRLPALFK